MTNPTCETCQYCNMQYRDSKGQEGGECRIRARHPEYGFAMVMAEEWCGEHKPVEEKHPRVLSGGLLTEADKAAIAAAEQARKAEREAYPDWQKDASAQ